MNGSDVALLERTLEEGGMSAADFAGIPTQRMAGEGMSGLPENLPGKIVREKEHPAKPMSVDEALSEMEHVGHDFYLFACAETGQPSVVYRRKGYDYGVIRLA
jgi:hypothetical protein